MRVPFRFRKATDYGLMIIAMLVGRGTGEIISVREMQAWGVPRSYIIKVAKILIKNKIIKAKEGRGGGYYLATDPSDIKLLQVIDLLEGKNNNHPCVHGAKCVLGDKCPHRGVMELLRPGLTQVLERHTAQDLGLK